MGWLGDGDDPQRAGSLGPQQSINWFCLSWMSSKLCRIISTSRLSSCKVTVNLPQPWYYRDFCPHGCTCTLPVTASLSNGNSMHSMPTGSWSTVNEVQHYYTNGAIKARTSQWLVRVYWHFEHVNSGYIMTRKFTSKQWYFSFQIYFHFDFYKFFCQSFLFLYYISIELTNYFSFHKFLYQSFLFYNISVLSETIISVSSSFNYD